MLQYSMQVADPFFLCCPANAAMAMRSVGVMREAAVAAVGASDYNLKSVKPDQPMLC